MRSCWPKRRPFCVPWAGTKAMTSPRVRPVHISCCQLDVVVESHTGLSESSDQNTDGQMRTGCRVLALVVGADSSSFMPRPYGPQSCPAGANLWRPVQLRQCQSSLAFAIYLLHSICTHQPELHMQLVMLAMCIGRWIDRGGDCGLPSKAGIVAGAFFACQH